MIYRLSSDTLLSELAIPIEYNEFGKIIWDIREKQRLLNAHPLNQVKDLTKLFPNRTTLAIKHMIRSMKLVKLPRWTQDELILLEKLTENFNFDWEWLSSHFPSRTTEAVRCQYYVKIHSLHKGRNIK